MQGGFPRLKPRDDVAEILRVNGSGRGRPRRGAGVQDVEGSRKLAWPQSLVILVKYRGLDEPLELRGPALVQHDPARIGPIWRLLGELRSDLAGLNPET